MPTILLVSLEPKPWSMLHALKACNHPLRRNGSNINWRVQRMSLVWVEQPGLPQRFEIAPLHCTANYNPRPFPRVESFSIASNLNIEPVFDGYKKSRDLRKILTKRTSHVQETFKNVHFFKLEQQRIKQVEIALNVDAEQGILFRSGSVVVTLQFRNRRGHPVTR